MVNDLVMLDELSEKSVLEAIRTRHAANEIYSYIGETLISVNPFKSMGALYGPAAMKAYVGKKSYMLPPHAYAVAERAYRNMMLQSENECVVITGESGAGKTEASKKCMEYIAFLASKSKHVQRVKEQLLETNPLLEAFGNAKTRRNDNSSRFGKYFEIQFKFGEPEGGRISQFLLEKNRVTNQQPGERNFHVFYQVLTDSSLCGRLGLSAGQHSQYKYFSDPSSAQVKTVNDAGDLAEMTRAMEWVGIKSEEQELIFQMLGGILHLGNVDFGGSREKSEVKNRDALSRAAKLLGLSEQDLGAALTNRTVKTATESVRTGLSPEMAAFARDALAKSVYSRLFDWIVARANETIHCEQFSTSIGVLDIYGFEILGVNGFEQLCINHTNERLHQLFIELTLRREQEEYKKEGIAWTTIDFFDNLPICEMIEKRGGLYALIDEESIFPQGTDASLMKKLAGNTRDKFFEQSKQNAAAQFLIKHYAGTVTYDTSGMLDSNKDTLFWDLVMTANAARNKIVASLFQDHPLAAKDQKTNKRPATVCMQYKQQVFDLMQTLTKCNQHYIRCIKPNDQKRAGLFQDDMTMEQVRYLGLLENVKVRRAGYAFRMPFDEFVAAYKVCLPGQTEFEPDTRRGVQAILSNAGAKDYEMGKTKVFIKNARTILGIEDARKAFLDQCAAWLPQDDGLIYADKVMGFAFNVMNQRTALNFVVGSKGFYWFNQQGQLEHFVSLQKADIIAFNRNEGWMCVGSTYPGKKPEDPPVQLNFLSENLHATQVIKFAEIMKTNMGLDLNVSESSSVPADARDPLLYKKNLKMIGAGALGLPMIDNGKPKGDGCCVVT